MDPDKVLLELRALEKDTHRALEEGVDNPVSLLEAWEEKFSSLDQWLSIGGFVPRDWKQHG